MDGMRLSVLSSTSVTKRTFPLPGDVETGFLASTFSFSPPVVMYNIRLPFSRRKPCHRTGNFLLLLSCWSFFLAETCIKKTSLFLPWPVTWPSLSATRGPPVFFPNTSPLFPRTRETPFFAPVHRRFGNKTFFNRESLRPQVKAKSLRDRTFSFSSCSFLPFFLLVQDARVLAAFFKMAAILNRPPSAGGRGALALPRGYIGSFFLSREVLRFPCFR